MPEPSWKEQTYWSSVIGTFLATLALAGFIGSRWQHEQPEAVRYEVTLKDDRAFSDPLNIVFFPLRFKKERQGKRSEPGKLSPAMEHRQAIDMIFRGERSLEMQRGPE